MYESNKRDKIIGIPTVQSDDGRFNIIIVVISEMNTIRDTQYRLHNRNCEKKMMKKKKKTILNFHRDDPILHQTIQRFILRNLIVSKPTKAIKIMKTIRTHRLRKKLDDFIGI